MTYGKRIKQAREDLHMTQEQLAEELDISRQAVSKWEAGLSRPAREKLEKLSAVLDIPPEDWTEIDAEAAAAELPPDTSRPWKTATAVLAALCVLLASALALLLFLLPRSREGMPVQDLPVFPENIPAAPAVDFPNTLPLAVQHDFEFGDIFFGEYGPELVPFLDDETGRRENTLVSVMFGDTVNHTPGDSAAFLEIVKANTRTDERGAEFSDIYLLSAVPDRRGNLDYQIMFRMAEENHCVHDSPNAVTVEPFFNVLGHDGYKISIAVDASGSWHYYITQRPDGTPCLMSTIGSMEADVDEDGVLEIVDRWYNDSTWQIIDTKEGEEGAFIYTLSPDHEGFPGVMNFALLQEKGGFVVPDSDGNVLGRYVLRDGEMVRLPLTDFSVLDYPDAAGTKLTFITEGEFLTDGLDPDELLPYTDTVRITHRQQAYLALQELYNLTGVKIDECYCTATNFGVLFSMMPDGFNQRSFFTMDFNNRYGNVNNIPSIYICWKELGKDWSPLSLEDAVCPDSSVKGDEEAMLWYYDRMSFFSAGLPACANEGAYDDEGELWLENGDLYTYYMEDTKYGSVLTRITGPYPGGIVNH